MTRRPRRRLTTALTSFFFFFVLFCAQREPEDRAGAGEAEGGAREAQGGGPGEEPAAAGAHVNARPRAARASSRHPLPSLSDFDPRLLFARVCVRRTQQDKREQARQDLKGLEETVVRHPRSIPNETHAVY